MSGQRRTLAVTVDAGELPVHLWGPPDGRPVVLLHGFPQTSLSWHGVVQRLRSARPDLLLVAPDQRGYAPTARPTEESAYGIEELAGDVLAVAGAVGAETFDLVGHDWGASLGWHVAARHPQRLRSLVALSIPHLAAFGWAVRHDPEQQRLSAYIADFRVPGRAEASMLADDARELREIYAGVVAADDVEAYVGLMRSGAIGPALAWYRGMGRELAGTPAVTVPTTYVWGTEDQAVSRAAAEACARHVEARYRFVELPGATHWSPDERPDEVAEAILHRLGDQAPQG